MDLLKVMNYITKHEGFKGRPYLDPTGKTTIGFGRNLEANPITRETGYQMLREDIDVITDRLCKFSEYRALSNNRKMVIIDMAYQMGVDGVLKYSKMWAAIKANDFNVAANEILNSNCGRLYGERERENSKFMRSG